VQAIAATNDLLMPLLLLLLIAAILMEMLTMCMALLMRQNGRRHVVDVWLYGKPN